MTHLGADRPRSLREGLAVFRRRWPEVAGSSEESPVFLLAAGWRCGSTLVQRMFSRECLVWGEPYEEAGLLDTLFDVFRRIRDDWPDESFFFRGQTAEKRTREFIANLYPPPAALAAAYASALDALFAEPARRAGVARWGIKSVRLSADHAHVLRWLYPRAKIVFLTRDPYDAYRSYRAIRHPRGVRWFARWPDQPLTTERFFRHWAELTASFLDECSPLQARLLRYEDLVSGRVDLAELADYLGISLAAEALAVNPGAWPVDSDQLDIEELDLLHRHTAIVAARLGYAPRPAAPHSPTPPPAVSADAESDYQQALAAHRQGDLETASRLYQGILARSPGHAGAWHFLGVIDLAQGRAALARERIERALSLCGDKAVYWNNFGAALLELGDWQRAEAALHRAIQLRRDYADAWANLAQVQQALRRSPSLVERSVGEALALDPQHVGALVQLGDFHAASGRWDAAIDAYRRAVSRMPEHRAAGPKLAQALASAGRLEEAVLAVEQLLVRAPEDARFQLMLGSFHSRLEQVEKAGQAFGRAAALRPDRPLWKWKYLSICPTVFEDEQGIERYWADLEHGLAEALAEPMTLDWRRLPKDGYTPSFNLPHHGRCCRQVRELFAARFERAFVLEPPEGNAGERVRVGFLITAGHELGFLRGMGEVVARLDREKFEPIVFCGQRAIERFRRAWPDGSVPLRPLQGRFEEVVHAVRAPRCDVMYYWKASPDPWSYFLPMARLAPVQCASCGSHGTTGLQAIDYYLSSPWMESTDRDIDPASHYTERLVGMATFPMFQSRQPMPEAVHRAEFGLPDSGALYVCPHRLPKYHPAFDGYLREILLQDQTGRIVLLGGSDVRARSRLQARMERRLGARLMERVHFQKAMPPVRYYRLLSLATLVLDTPCYVSSLTAYDSFSVGVPVLTQLGPLAVQCYAAGLYRRMGIDDLVAHDREDYVGRAVALAKDRDQRERLVQLIRERDHLVFDDSMVISEYERFFLAATGRDAALRQFERP